jgi:hypothetical protein
MRCACFVLPHVIKERTCRGAATLKTRRAVAVVRRDARSSPTPQVERASMRCARCWRCRSSTTEGIENCLPSRPKSEATALRRAVGACSHQIFSRLRAVECGRAAMGYFFPPARRAGKPSSAVRVIPRTRRCPALVPVRASRAVPSRPNTPCGRGALLEITVLPSA